VTGASPAHALAIRRLRPLFSRAQGVFSGVGPSYPSTPQGLHSL
jgi:hypothetical protein